MTTVTVPALLALLLASSPAFAQQRPNPRAELKALEKDFEFKILLASRDIVSDGPAPGGGRFTELGDGSYYKHADPKVAFEKLAPLKIDQAVLRKGGRRILLVLVPPSDVRPWYLADQLTPELSRSIAIDVDIPPSGSVADALRTVVHLPGDRPSDEDVKQCMERYSDMTEERSRLRCGLGGEGGRRVAPGRH